MTARVSTEPSLTPDTPRERELRKQVNDLLLKIGRMAVDHDRQMANVTDTRDRAMSEVSIAQQGSGAHRRRMEALEKNVADYLRERSVLVARIEAGTERRREMVHVLNALLTCEDDEALTDAQHDARMDSIIKKARTLVAAEKATILKGGEKSS